MSELNPSAQRDFAVEVLRRLREAGCEALWAGGCVRDHLLGRRPKDYDVATNAEPSKVQAIFGRRTLAIGEAFGVIAVLGSKEQGAVEVATFRRDVGYTDGRHPGRVEFSSAAEDAQRRDFTINGLFYDPLANEVIDYVGGQDDLRVGLVRAIGDPRLRFEEDKLRMLRGIRMAATFDFQLDAATFAAVGAMAQQVTVVSPERIAQEMRLTLALPRHTTAVNLLRESGLLAAILPEALNRSARSWSEVTATLAATATPSFTLSLAMLLLPEDDTNTDRACEAALLAARRWRLSNKELERVGWLIAHSTALVAAAGRPWSQVQRHLITEGSDELLELHAARARAAGESLTDVEFCRARVSWPAEQLNPPPLLTGDDLRRHGIAPGPVYARLLEAVRDAQLDGQLTDQPAALQFADAWLKRG